MTAAEVRKLLVVLHGYWPMSAPPDDTLTLAAWSDLLDDIALDDAVAAARKLALDGDRFCPPPGVIAAEAKASPLVPPYYKPWVDELPEVTGSDREAVVASFAEARRRLRMIRGEAS